MNRIDQIVTAQFETAALLAESSAKGFIVDVDILQDQINIFEKEVEFQEVQVRQIIRDLMNWN